MEITEKQKPPYTLIIIILILLGISASILLTQGNKGSSTNAPLADQINNPDGIDLPTTSPSTLFENLIFQGDTAFLSRNYTKALSYYINAYQANPEAIDPFIKIIKVYLATENYPLALKNIELASERSAKNPEIIVAQIRYQLAQNNITAAISTGLTITPPTDRIRLYQAITYIMADDTEQARALLKDLPEQTTDPEVKQISSRLQENFQLFSTFESGSQAYLNTLLGQTLLRLKEYKLARTLFYRAIETSSDFRDAWVGLGYSFLQIKNYDQAEQALDRARQIDPYKPEVYFYLAILSEEQNNNKRALGLLNQAKNYGYNDTIAINEHLASNYYAIKEYDQAINNYQAVIDAKKVPINYFVAPIWIYLEIQKDYNKALAIAQKSITYYPNIAESYNYLGWVQLYRQEYDQAKANLTTAISKNPQLAAAYLNFGLLFKQQGKDISALPYFQQAAKLAKAQQDYSIEDRANKEYELSKKTLETQTEALNTN